MANKNITEYLLIHLEVKNLSEVLQELYTAFNGTKKSITRLTLFASLADNTAYTTLREGLQEQAKSVWGEENRPVISLVAQPTLESNATLEVHSITLGEGESISYRNYALGGRSVAIERAFGRQLFIGELQHDVEHYTIESQSTEVFATAQAIFDYEKLPYNSIVRQWNYIERITEMEGDNQHYQLFNNARSAFYNQTVWDNGYPAATGIGCDWGGIGVDMDVVVGDECTILPIDNKLQVAAHAYSESVLEDANSNKSTPKFERAKSLSSVGYTKLTYISGTAAIRGEESLATADAAQQCENTFENIEQLVDIDETTILLRIYLKDEKDYQAVKQVVEKRYYETKPYIVYLKGDVCREELLVEIEGISILN